MTDLGHEPRGGSPEAGPVPDSLLEQRAYRSKHALAAARRTAGEWPLTGPPVGVPLRRMAVTQPPVGAEPPPAGTEPPEAPESEPAPTPTPARAPRWRGRILPRSVLGICALILAFSLGASLSGVVL